MSAKVTGLGHIGFYVHDLELMMDFYENFMGMQRTKIGPLGAFYSADPESCDHEIALINGRPSVEDPHWIQQISMRVDSLDVIGRVHSGLKTDIFPRPKTAKAPT